MPAWSSFGAVVEVRIAAFGNSHFTSSLPVTSNLLHWTVWLLSTTIYIGHDMLSTSVFELLVLLDEQDR